MSAPDAMDVCRCGCLREDHPGDGPCDHDFGCRPPCAGFVLADTAAEMDRYCEAALRNMRREARERAMAGIDEEGLWKP